MILKNYFFGMHTTPHIGFFIVSFFGLSTSPLNAQQPIDDQTIQQRISKLTANLTFEEARVEHVLSEVDNIILEVNQACTIAAVAATKAKDTLEISRQSLDIANSASHIATEATTAMSQIRDEQKTILQNMQTAKNATLEAAQNITTNIENTYKQLKKDFIELTQQQQQQSLNEHIQIELAKLNELEKKGFFEKKARLEAQAAVDVEKIRWENIKSFFENPKYIATLLISVALVASIIYIAKHGIPLFVNHFVQPRVIIETSKKFLYDTNNDPAENDLNNLFFTSSLQKQLLDLSMRIQSTKKYNERYPNILLYGAPGTGKTAFAKALAHLSGLDYAITSGSEFAKITNLNDANNELRKLLEWANKDEKGLLVFIDEAESLFANRKLPTTPKWTQDFINTFLSLISDKAQKNVLFIFATNHPFKLDDAILDRIGPKIEFVLPDLATRIHIFALYLEKFSHENKFALVDIHSEVKEKIATYAAAMEGLSPRSIKFIAEEMIARARRQECKILTHDIVQSVLTEEKNNLTQEINWEKARNQWLTTTRYIECY
jgi:ATPase family AAA domain-containing protein 3A/B